MKQNKMAAKVLYKVRLDDFTPYSYTVINILLCIPIIKYEQINIVVFISIPFTGVPCLFQLPTHTLLKEIGAIRAISISTSASFTTFHELIFLKSMLKRI